MGKVAAVVVVVGVVIVLLVALSRFKGPGLGEGNGRTGEQPSSGQSTMVTIVVEGDQYKMDGTARPLGEIVSAAGNAGKSGKQVLMQKKGNARYLTVKQVQDELDHAGVQYRIEDSF